MTRSRVLVVALVLFVAGIWGYDLWAPDEPYFAEGAREMVVDGSWTVPHVNGVVTTDKPPLIFWSIAVLSLPFQAVSSVTARLPSVLASLVTLLLTMRLCRRFYGERAAGYAGAVLCVTYLFWDKARTAQTDALLCCCIMVAISAFEAFRARSSGGRNAGMLFWAAAGLAVLTKGPVGVLLPVCYVLVTLAWDRKLRRLLEFAPLTGPLVFAAVIGAWVLPASLWDPEAYTVTGALKEHFVDRAISGMHHAQPFWYYAKALPPLLFPWLLLAPGAVVVGWRNRDSAERLLLTIVFFTILFFSISTEKRALYVLPAFPAFAILIARLIDRVLHPDSDRPGPRGWVVVPQWMLASILLPAGTALVVMSGKVDDLPRWSVTTLGVLLAATGAAGVWMLSRRRLDRSLCALGIGTAAIYLFAALLVFPQLNGVKSSRAFSETMTEQIPAVARERGVVAFHLRNLPEAFAFYTDGMYTLETKQVEELERHLDRPELVYAVIDVDLAAPLSEEVAARMVTVAEARLSRKNVALVHNGGTPGS